VPGYGCQICCCWTHWGRGVLPIGMRMQRSEIGTPIHPMKNVKNPISSQPSAHMEHQIIQKIRVLLMGGCRFPSSDR
jgi:hypothetical protein